MNDPSELFKQNRAWADQVKNSDPDFFNRLSAKQEPNYLWIGCADSRVPPGKICGLDPGQMFVHRNVANVFVHTDFNALSVLQYAVEYLQVEHVIVCGHYRCGGVGAALENKSLGLLDNWLRHIKDVYERHRAELSDDSMTPEARFDRLCELNVAAQVAHLCHTTIIQEAWARGQNLSVHGWIYGLHDGLLKDLGLSFSALDQLPSIYRIA